MDPTRKSELGQQLLRAAYDGDLSRVESLIAQGADVNHTETNEGVSTLSYGVTIISILLCVCSCDAE
jgi:hypothetical protein